MDEDRLNNNLIDIENAMLEQTEMLKEMLVELRKLTAQRGTWTPLALYQRPECPFADCDSPEKCQAQERCHHRETA